ncbi:hypothetical protein CABS01_03935 [Colletotrichum abscissum]|uniref:Ornithine cyclodeaminase n=1 Tax=Colletotrichum abscissum TaxID=1671311 RepID=A0A9Q0B3L8_9PEZI|nr:uncharacterized protein CABS01_03935 [Colletotrichum abscissum]KAI3553745.1 hypothetical protein CABS02_06078 [Colletotrichum abscissum]KAK1475658.1 hypothetical protein CABS01_03935 [Colletotrichum abscissum]
MGNFRVLSDAAVLDILLNLPRSGILQLRDRLVGALIELSEGAERDYQPDASIVNRPEGMKCLFRPFSSAGAFGTKIVVTPAPSSPAANSLHGIISICDQDGLPLGVINAEEVTGYRTALSAIVPYLWRSHTDNIVVFGAGKQALWHLRFALSLRGDEIKTITVANRSAERAQQLISRLKEENQGRWKSTADFEYLSSSSSEYDAQLQYRLAAADAIFCTVGTKSPVFPAHYVTNGRKERNPYISAVGSWQADMLEVDPELLVQATNAAGGKLREQGSKLAVLVDDRESALKHSGEIVQSKLAAEYIVEIGEIEISRKRGEKLESLSTLEDGLIIYKSIGVSTTDLAIGTAILDIAEKKGAGTVIPEF